MNGGSCRWQEPAVDALVDEIREAIQAVVASATSTCSPCLPTLRAHGWGHTFVRCTPSLRGRIPPGTTASRSSTSPPTAWRPAARTRPPSRSSARVSPFHVVAAGRDWNPQLVSRSRAWGAAARAADRHTDPTDPHRLRETGRRLGISYPSHVGVSDPLAGWIRGHKQRDRRRQPPDPLELAGMPESIIFAVRRVGARGARDQPPLLTEAETSATFLASTHETRSQSH